MIVTECSQERKRELEHALLTDAPPDDVLKPAAGVSHISNAYILNLTAFQFPYNKVLPTAGLETIEHRPEVLKRCKRDEVLMKNGATNNLVCVSHVVSRFCH